MNRRDFYRSGCRSRIERGLPQYLVQLPFSYDNVLVDHFFGLTVIHFQVAVGSSKFHTPWMPRF